MTAARYEIRTVHDFTKVPETLRELCLREFRHWLAVVDSVVHLQIVPPEAFVWIDDGKHEARLNLTVVIGGFES